jgi:hypothetical protein
MAPCPLGTSNPTHPKLTSHLGLPRLSGLRAVKKAPAEWAVTRLLFIHLHNSAIFTGLRSSLTLAAQIITN